MARNESLQTLAADLQVALNNVEASVDNVTKLEATLAKEIDKRLGAGSAGPPAPAPTWPRAWPAPAVRPP